MMPPYAMAPPPPRPVDPELEVHLVVRGDPGSARYQLEHAMMTLGWRIQWGFDGWSGTASKGDKTLHMLFGVFAMYYEAQVHLRPLAPGVMGVTVYRVGTGCMGGLLGAMKVRAEFRRVGEYLPQVFAHYGVLQQVGRY